jgi:hypothetical protein
MYPLVSRRSLLRAGLATGAALAFGVGLRLDAPAAGARLLSVEEMEILRALAEVMFPAGVFPVDGLEARVPEEVDRIVADMMEEPATSAFRYVLRAIEWGTLASRGLRFSRLPAEARAEVLEVWSEPMVLPRRVAHDSLRLVLGMAYFNHPAVLGAIGWRTGCGGGRS